MAHNPMGLLEVAEKSVVLKGRDFSPAVTGLFFHVAKQAAEKRLLLRVLCFSVRVFRVRMLPLSVDVDL
jgi:hypothetical protein